MREVDKEWNEAEKILEKSSYYKCKMLNGGWCYKKYKPEVAKLLLKRGRYLEMLLVKEI